MTDSTGTGNAPEAQGATLLQKPGELIRAKREAAGMTQAQVGEALHLTVHYIKSLENDEYSKLPGLTFVKGYMRSYARLLKLDEAAIIACYDQYVASLGLQESTQEQSIRVRRRNDQAILWAVVAGVILVIGLGAGWWFFGREDGAAAATVVAVRTPEPVNTTVTQTPPAQTPPAQMAITPAAVRQDPFANQGAASASAQAAASLPNTTTLMTEDGPVVLDNASEDPAATTAVVATAGAALVATAAPDTAESTADEFGADELGADESGADDDLGAAATVAAGAAATADISATSDSAPAADAAQADPAAATPALATTSTGANTRRVELVGNGADQLELQFAGNSWVEVDDGARVRLYSDMMRDGDALSIKAAAPFHILLGDATGVAVLLNGQPLPIAANIRTDKTARIMISAEGVSAWAVE